MLSSYKHRRELGARAESLACEHLVARGFTIIARNLRVGALELDIVARRGDLIVFCEVRARSRSGFVSPLETIDRAKIRRVREAASRWLHERGCRRVAVRFDAAAVVFDRPEGELEYVENAF